MYDGVLKTDINEGHDYWRELLNPFSKSKNSGHTILPRFILYYPFAMSAICKTTNNLWHARTCISIWLNGSYCTYLFKKFVISQKFKLEFTRGEYTIRTGICTLPLLDSSVVNLLMKRRIYYYQRFSRSPQCNLFMSEYSILFWVCEPYERTRPPPQYYYIYTLNWWYARRIKARKILIIYVE